MVGVWMFTAAWQRRAKAVRVVDQLVGNCRDQDILGHLWQLQQRVDADEGDGGVQREANEPQATLPGIAILNLDMVHAWRIAKIVLPDLVEVERQLLPALSTVCVCGNGQGREHEKDSFK